jgi:glycosyltransferase involved in cell wall biosynthesis
MKFSIVIPVFNERNYLPIFAENLRKAPISSAITEVEIIVVDDASTDGSHEISQQLFADFALDANVRCTTHVLKNDENQGKGFSVRKGIEHSTGDILIIQDADQGYSMQDYPQMLEPIIANQADVVFGSRFTGSSRRVLFF